MHRIGVEATFLLGEYQDNFPLPSLRHGLRDTQDADAAGFVLKVMPPARARSSLDMQCRALQHLAMHAPQLTLPRVRLDRNGEAFAAISATDGSQRLVWLLSYVPGTMLAKARPHSPELLQSLGQDRKSVV